MPKNNLPLTGPTDPQKLALILATVFQAAGVPYTRGQFDPGTATIDRWQRLTCDNPEAIGLVFWELTQTMLMRDAVALYLGLAQAAVAHDTDGVIPDVAVDRIAGHCMLGKAPHALGMTVLGAAWAAEKRQR